MSLAAISERQPRGCKKGVEAAGEAASFSFLFRAGGLKFLLNGKNGTVFQIADGFREFSEWLKVRFSIARLKVNNQLVERNLRNSIKRLQLPISVELKAQYALQIFYHGQPLVDLYRDLFGLSFALNPRGFIRGNPPKSPPK